jgi:hypothetical protein
LSGILDDRRAGGKEGGKHKRLMGMWRGIIHGTFYHGLRVAAVIPYGVIPLCMDVHTQGEITPYAGGVNDIQTRGKMITTTTGLRTENNTLTSGRYSIKNPKRGLLNHIVWMSGRRP